MRKTLVLSLATAAVCVPALASAQQAASSPHTVSGNMTIASDYRFRGISQTVLAPAIQGGIDYGHASGLYVGNWDSSVSGLSYSNGAGIEMDVYGGWKKELAKDFTLDVGLLQYLYPNAQIVGATAKTKYDTLELYVGGAYKWFTLKYSYAMSTFFGIKTETYGGACNRNGADCFVAAPGDSKGSNYLDLSFSYEIAPKLTLAAHVGQQKVKNFAKLDYRDYKLGVSYDLAGWALGAAYIGTNADKNWYYVTDGAGTTKDLGKGGLVLTAGKTF